MNRSKLARLPDACGVYIFRDKKGDILYIGKAHSLKKRIKTYFLCPASFKIQIMASKIAHVDCIITDTEPQARLKEAELIKKYLPVYNTALRDDKSFPLICISKEDFPVIWIARRGNKRLINSLSRYFGPYADAGLLKQALISIRHIFGFRSCFKMPKKACLYYRLNLCPAPCAGRIKARQYQGIVKNIVLFLEGRQQDLINRLCARMQKLSGAKKYEQAALIRNQIQALNSVSRAGHGQDKVRRESLPDSLHESAELKKILGLNARPQRIEAFDVSNIFGTSACASMVSFYDGKPDKNNYRRFRIKSASGIDDYGMLEEAISRRYRRLIEEKLPLPDLIIVDGGKGQLNIAKRKVKQLGLGLPVISIAKPHRESISSSRRLQDRIFVSGKSRPILLDSDCAALHLVQRVRDEAHRFALAYHRVLRRKKTLGK